MAWTTKQQDAIDARNCNLLVSAAAGSGKTAVLIERIIQRVLDKDNPIDIDTIVVVTFTRAAAEEMKNRLGIAFENELKKNPGNRYLLKQISLLDNARITTIDSFCTYILRNYYNSIGLEPDFRVADEGELNLIREDVLQEILEEKFEQQDAEFLDFVEAFAPGKSINKISELVLGLHRFSQSNPWPIEWLMECDSVFSVETVEEYEKLTAVTDTIKYIKQVCRDCITECDIILGYCYDVGGPVEYVPAITHDREMWIECSKCNSLESIKKILDREDETLGRSKADANLRKLIQTIRKKSKSRKELLLKKYCIDMETQLEQLKACRGYAQIYLALTIEFTLRYKEYKRKQNIVDFSDIEHYALDILINREDGNNTYTEVANELAWSFNEIYIDEYQDSNPVQEYILSAVSRERFNEPNIFMVGDVKQSIYKFRMAKPELFMEKYDLYPDYDSENTRPYNKIELHHNFRSHENVLESVNDVFSKIMKKTVGGIDYTDEVRLNAAKDFTDGINDITEVLVVDRKELKNNKINKREACAHIAADRIKNLIQDNEGLSYKDFVILLRSDKSAGPVYASVLASHGIPSIYASSTGYFTAYEVVNVLDFLRVIDNPRQEIPLAGLMRSFWTYFDAEELAEIKGSKRRTEFYDCVVSYSAYDNPLGSKCREFLDMLLEYRNKSEIYTIRELVSLLIYDSGYYDYVGAMRGGESKKANLDMLVQKAKEFEQTSYSGVFNFLRYIDKLQKYDVDYGVDNTAESAENAVRIMSIHKSKGLEFPIVIIGDSAKKYNLRDASDSVIYDSDLGIGMDYIDLKRRTRENTVYKNFVSGKIVSDGIGEELRVLYVAMTRAVNKLIMIGSTGMDKALPKWEKVYEDGIMESNYIIENTNYLDLVAPVALHNPRFIFEEVSIDSLVNIIDTPSAEIMDDMRTAIDILDENPIDEDLYNQIKQKLEYKYPYSNILSIKSKYSVSDLKHKAMEESEILEARIASPESGKVIPRFIEETEEAVTGVFRGNAYHKFFELLDYNYVVDVTQIQKQLNDRVEEGIMPKEYAELINCNKFLKFASTELGQDMKNAFLDKKLYREQPFIMQVGADSVNPDFPSEEKVLVQGIIDAFYIKDDMVYIVDYKTDSVPYDSGEEILISRYRRQLELYADAIEKVTGKKVADCYIYSVSLDRAISIN